MNDLPEEVVRYEPHEALMAGSDPLRYYRALIERAGERLTLGGWLVAEVQSDYGHDVAALASSAGLSGVDVRTDLAGLPRVLIAQRTCRDVPESTRSV
jgi:release factor glutamine methyltransferase